MYPKLYIHFVGDVTLLEWDRWDIDLVLCTTLAVNYVLKRAFDTKPFLWNWLVNLSLLMLK